MSNVYTAAEVERHNTRDDCWMVVQGVVYDVTKFLDAHPGGAGALTLVAGKDATQEFFEVHGPRTLNGIAKKFRIGTLSASENAKLVARRQVSVAGVPEHTIESLGLKPSSTPSWNSGGTSHLLPAERAKASFDVVKMTQEIYGGAKAVRRRRFILAPQKLKPIGDSKYHMSRQQLMHRHVSDFIGMHSSFAKEMYIPERGEIAHMTSNSVNSGSLMPHYGLFLPTILGQGSQEQIMHWLPRALRFEIIGSYAQTELGHGSNVRGLQTIAEYDKKTGEFVLNTPTLQSMKWWNSNMGCAATHATVYAQLIIDGKEYGLHVFMLQVRDENHLPLPGIEIGDCGPKMGDHAVDTGYLRLQDVRIPREHMMCARQRVTADGKYIKKSKKKKGGNGDKLHYATMMMARNGMVTSSGGRLAICATIAVRYSAVRHQGFVNTSSGVSFRSAERPILDYQFQMYRLLKQVSLSYAIAFTGQWMSRRFDTLQKAIRGDVSEEEAAAAFEDLPEIHATAAGLKGLCTKIAHDGMEDCRKACGGHGYLLASGVAAYSADYVWQVTAEGDFVVMLLQTARFLMKQYQAARSGAKLAGLTQCLEEFRNAGFDPVRDAAPKPASGPADMLDIDYLLSLFRWRAMVAVHDASKRLDAQLALGKDADTARNAVALTMVRTAVSHCTYFLLQNFVERVHEVKDAAVKKVLHRICALFALSNILDGQQWTGLLTGDQVRFADDAVAELLNALRPDAVSIVDAFDIPDRVLCSALGRFDGNVYEQLYVSARKTNVNQQPVFDGYAALKPHLNRKLLLLHNRVAPEDFEDMTEDQIRAYVQKEQHIASAL
jgi:acyl-CoA oxidase